MPPAPVDLKTLPQQYPHGQRLHAAPAVWLFENFASAEELQALTQAAREKLQPAEVSGDKGGYLSPGRSGSNCWIDHTHSALTLQLAERVSKLVRIPLQQAESFQIVYYGPGQEYKPHFDAWDDDSERGRRCMERGGQRLVTALLYLNHVEAGGATSFPKLGLEVHPLRGNLLLFHNCYAGTNRKHENSLHGGMPVTAGEKWAANLWFRERDYR
jgi:prolyl 4-hydroxylase